MTEPNNTPTLKPEIVAPPSISNLSVAQVGTGMFSVSMQVVMVVRFPTGVPSGLTEHTAPAPQSLAIEPTTVRTNGELMYGNGELPNAFDGEAEGFQAFVHVHGYVPPTRDVLIQWASNSQGGA